MLTLCKSLKHVWKHKYMQLTVIKHLCLIIVKLDTVLIILTWLICELTSFHSTGCKICRHFYDLVFIGV